MQRIIDPFPFWFLASPSFALCATIVGPLSVPYASEDPPGVSLTPHTHGGKELNYHLDFYFPTFTNLR
ncbi:MAG: hypothetical protein WB699_00805 [Bacteroidota bacterium]